MKILYLLFLLILTNVTYALNEDEFIDLILSSNKLFLSDEIDLYSQQERLKSKKQDYYGWDFVLTSKYNFEKLNSKKDSSYTYVSDQIERDKNITIKASTAFENGISFNVKLSRNLPYNDYDKSKNLEFYKHYNTTEYNTELTTNLNIPLLKNNNGGTNNLYYNNAKIDNNIETYKLLESKEDILEEKLSLFIELVINIRKVDVAKNYLKNSQNLVEKITSSNFKDKIKKRNITLVNNKIIKIKRILATNIANLADTKKKLRYDIDFSKNIDDKINFNHLKRVTLIRNVSNYVVKNNRDLRISRLDQSKKKNYIDNYKNQQLADFDFNLWTTNNRNRGNYSSYSYYYKNDFGMSLDFSYFFGGSASLKYNLLDAKLDYQKKIIDYRDELKDKIEDIELLSSELTLKKSNLNLFIRQIKITNNELNKYLNDDDIRFVLNELIEFYDLKLEYLDEELNYHQARIKYENLIDRLLDENKIKCEFCWRNVI